MRIAFVSDIHANLQAWKSVHADITAHRVDRIICLGDIVGYGPAPVEVLNSVYAKVNHFVLGNHDAVVGGLLSPEGFAPHAQALIRRTCEQLSDRAEEFFRHIPLSLADGDFCCAHANPVDPHHFTYVFSSAEAFTIWDECDSQIVFIGHTHRPMLHILHPDGHYEERGPDGHHVKLKPGCRYLANCGAVGMSRDEDFRASYVVYDEEKNTLQWHRVAYDMEAFAEQVRRTYSVPELKGFLLDRMRIRQREPVRELIDFSPETVSLSDSVETRHQIQHAHARAARWKRVALAVAALLLVAGLAFFFLWRSLPRPGSVRAPERKILRLSEAKTTKVVEHNLLGADTTDGSLPAGWKVEYEDQRRQEVRVSPDGVEMYSGRRGRSIELLLPRIEVGEMSRITFTADGVREMPWQGDTPLLLVRYIYQGGRSRQTAVVEPFVVDGGEIHVRRTIDSLPDELWGIRVRIRCRFQGRIHLDAMNVRASRNGLVEHDR